MRAHTVEKDGWLERQQLTDIIIINMPESELNEESRATSQRARA